MIGRVVRRPSGTGSRSISPAIGEPDGPTTGGRAPSGTTAARRDTSTPVVVGLAVLAFAVSAVAVVVRFSGDLHPLGDIALTELTVREVGHHPVLLGPYSRFDWSHPGPMLFYVLAGPYRALGGSSAALYAGAALVNGAMAGLVVGVCARRGGRALGWWSLLVVGVFSWALGPAVLRYPWNPYVTVLATAALVVVVWALTAGEAWALPTAFGLGTFLVQSHVGYTPVTAVLLGVGVGAYALHRWVDHRRGRLTWRPTLVAAAVTVAVIAVLWAPPVWQQLTRDPGNLGELRLYFSEHSGEHSVREGYDAVVPWLGVIPNQLATRRPGAAMGTAAPDWATIVTVVAFGLATVAALWRRAWDAARLGALVLVAVPVAVVAAARVTGDIYEYLVIWVSAVGLVAWIAVGAAATQVAPRLRAAGSRWASGALAATVAAAVAVTALNAAEALDAPAPDAGVQAISARVADRVVSATRDLPGDGSVWVRLGDNVSWSLGAGAVLALDRHGIPVTVEPRLENLFGEQLTRSRTAPAAILTLTLDGSPADGRARGRAGNRLIAAIVSPDIERDIHFWLAATEPEGPASGSRP